MRFSVIVPLYNCEKYIDKCLESLINQKYNDYEIIVVNDGSTDKSLEIVNSLIYDKKNIKVITQENQGLSGARNTGIKNSIGEYLVFIDADDFVEESLLFELDKTISDQDIIIYGFYSDTYVNDKFVSSKEMYCKNNDFSNCIEQMDILELSTILGFAWNKAYKRKFIKENNINFDVGISLIEDILFNSKVLMETNNLSIISKPLTHYINRVSRVTLSTKKYTNLDELLYAGLSKRIEIFEKFNKNFSINQKTNLFEFNLIYFLQKDGNGVFTSRKKIKKFVGYFKNQIDYNLIKNKIIRYLLKIKLYTILILLYRIKERWERK